MEIYSGLLSLTRDKHQRKLLAILLEMLMRVKTKVMTTMLEVLAIRVESDCVRQVLRSGRKAGSRVHKSMYIAQCGAHFIHSTERSVHCAVVHCAVVQ